MSGFPDLYADPFTASTLGGGGGPVIRFDNEPDEETEPWQGPPKERLRKETAVCYLGHMEWENSDTAETGDSGWGEPSHYRRTPTYTRVSPNVSTHLPPQPLNPDIFTQSPRSHTPGQTAGSVRLTPPVTMRSRPSGWT